MTWDSVGRKNGDGWAQDFICQKNKDNKNFKIMYYSITFWKILPYCTVGAFFPKVFLAKLFNFPSQHPCRSHVDAASAVTNGVNR